MSTQPPTRNSVPAIDTGAIRKVRRPRELRRVAKVSGYVLGSIVMLVLLAVTFLHTPWGKAFVRGRVEAALAKKVNGTVTVGALDYGFLFGTVSLSDVEIRDASGAKAIAVHQVHIALDRGALLSKELILDELAITDLDVNLVKRADGTSNLTGLFKPSPARKPMKHVQIHKLSLSGDATITKPGKTIKVEDLWLAGRADLHPAAKQTALVLDKVSAHVAINDKQLDVALASIVLGKTATNIDLDIASIDAGALAIEKLAAHVKLENGKPRGDQAISLGTAHVDADKLAALAGRKILVDDIALSLSLVGPADKLALAASVEAPNRTTLTLDGVLDIVTAKPRYELSLAAAGKATDVLVPRPGKKLPAIAADVRLAVKGQGIKAADLDAQFDLAAQAVGFEIASTGAVVAGTVDAKLGVDGNVAEALDVLADAGIKVSRKVPRIGALDLDITAKGPLKGELAVALAPTKIALAGGSVALRGDAMLVNRKLSVAHANVTLSKLDLASLSKLAGRPPKAKGSLSGTVALTKTATSKSAAFDLAVALADKPLVIAASGTATPGSSVAADIEVRRASDASVLAAIDAKLPLAGKTLAPNGSLSLSIDVARRQLAELASLLPPRLRAKLPAGDIAVHADITGTPARPTGTITVASAGRHDVALTAAIAPGAQGLTITTDGSFGLDHSTLATLHGTIAVPSLFKGSKLDIKSARAGMTVEATIDLPARPVASLAQYRAKLAKLAKLDGTIGGRIAVTGALETPSLDAQLAWSGYRTATGATGETTLAATGSPKQLALSISHGKAVAITADVDRTIPGTIAVDAKMRAAKTALLPLLPAFAAKKLAAVDLGTLDWNMDANLVLVKDAAGKLGLDTANVTGTLDVTGGSFTLPGTKRRYKDIALSVAAEPAGIRIKSLTLHESDREKADRLLSISGLLGLSKMKPARVDLQLAARDWLVFGGEKFGKIDAPRASASFDIGVAVDLTKPIIAVDATIKALALRSPDRQERAHHVENISPNGDIIFVDGKQTKLGKLPVLAQVATAAPKKRRPLDVRVHIPTAIRIEQTPMDFMTKGELAITVREDGVKTRGQLTMESGKLQLFGHDHTLTSGSITFSDAHPKGFMKVTFERKLPSYALRDLAANGDTSKVSFEGSPTKPKASLSGAAGAALADIMAMYNAGRPLSTARPGLPASNVVEAPRGDQLMMLTFMASNLPHLLFLDRISAWADPTRGYGQLTNMEAESYAKNNKSRVRAVVRPSTPGRSNAELQYDRLLINDDHTAAGVSVRAGDRIGGGVGVFLEWSSR